jgi:energy-dependent translational throttle protein EttA
VNVYEGNFSEYSTWLKATYGADIVEPHRLKYKRMVK